MIKPILSIVTPTREGFSEHWLKKLLEVKGDLEFILVHPPGMTKPSIDDPRVQQINSPLRGEVIQRITGLTNASGTYTLSLNCDEYLTPDILEIVLQYFKRFPNSWVMRLSRKEFDYGRKAELEAPWSKISPIDELKICGKSLGNHKSYDKNKDLYEIPIAPLENQFDWRCFIRERSDHHGPHLENFDKKVWQTSMVQESLKDLMPMLNLGGPFKYVPFWTLDRLLGLYVQAKFYEKDQVIGHLLPLPEQIRLEDNPPEYRRSPLRLYILAEVLLLKKFPQYGYFWNLIINHIRDFPLIAAKVIKEQIPTKQPQIEKLS